MWYKVQYKMIWYSMVAEEKGGGAMLGCDMIW